MTASAPLSDPADLARLADRRVLVTGGAGAIGSNLVARLLALGAREVVVLDDLTAGHRWAVPDDPRVTFVEAAVTDEAALERVFADRPEIVFHLAAFFANQNSVEHPRLDLETNGFGTLALLEQAARADPERFVYASSGCSIYGSDAPLPLSEEAVSLDLSSPYQITKMLGELYGNFYRRHHDVPVVNARLFNSYGPGEVPGRYRNVIPNFLWWARHGRPLPITGSGEETRDFTFVDDVVDGLVRCAVVDDAAGLAVNIASGVETPISRIAELVNEATGNDGGIVARPARQWDTKSRLLADIDLARSKLGYRPTVDIESGIDRTAAWFDARWEQLRAAARFERS